MKVHLFVALAQQVKDSRCVKLGSIAITAQTIEERISEVLNIPVCPVTIHCDRSDSISALGNFLFNSKKSFFKFGEGKLSIMSVCMLAIAITLALLP